MSLLNQKILDNWGITELLFHIRNHPLIIKKLRLKKEKKSMVIQHKRKKRLNFLVVQLNLHQNQKKKLLRNQNLNQLNMRKPSMKNLSTRSLSMRSLSMKNQSK